ncbi:haloacid dehalogenase [Mycolicibacterium madagascariense]|uniref:Haloacid dehalogenase n=1 Tax=Mycolicibacterium madagascariense TaxID=212765 RepID=A0A7I7X9D2_9MYCO|nr:HAD-IA family hydrolase [Mycolicibacterium madagascariense]MCV7013396.1 HAD-IA family hydrolase [Mycolicibacterium madagascariense]BBZ25885.1 haloacid dehalogenase [Mycolicibacterium madagascariense]
MTYDVVVFDVLGTVVDEDEARKRATATLFASAGRSADAVDAFALAWDEAESELIGAVAGARAGWETHDAICLKALRDIVRRDEAGASFSAEAMSTAALFGRDIEPWPESVRAIDALRAERPVIALTNGSAPTMAEMSRRTGLRWTELISADDVETFKPNPRMYERLTSRGIAEPRTTLFVAAHPWDLDTAAQHCYRTALVLRPGVPAEAGYDHLVDDLDGIVALFSATAG